MGTTMGAPQIRGAISDAPARSDAATDRADANEHGKLPLQQIIQQQTPRVSNDADAEEWRLLNLDALYYADGIAVCDVCDGKEVDLRELFARDDVALFFRDGTRFDERFLPHLADALVSVSPMLERHLVM